MNRLPTSESAHFRVAAVRRIMTLIVLAMACSGPGCGGKSPVKSNGKTSPKIDPPKIATEPDADVLDEAFRKHGGDVEQALDSLVPEVDRKSLIIRNAAGKIEAVDLSGMSLKTAGIQHLLALKETLQRVNLGQVYVTDDALAAIASLPHLRKLELNQTPVTDAGLAHLARATQLRELSLKRTKITDDGLKHLAALKHLRLLSLTWTGVTDDGLTHLAELNELHTLILDDTAVSDAGLEHLTGLKKLAFVHVTETQVTPEGVAKLKRSLPRVEVRGP
jgi:Leucine Rich repeat